MMIRQNFVVNVNLIIVASEKRLVGRERNELPSRMSNSSLRRMMTLMRMMKRMLMVTIVKRRRRKRMMRQKLHLSDCLLSTKCIDQTKGGKRGSVRWTNCNIFIKLAHQRGTELNGQVIIDLSFSSKLGRGRD